MNLDCNFKPSKRSQHQRLMLVVASNKQQVDTRVYSFCLSDLSAERNVLFLTGEAVAFVQNMKLNIVFCLLCTRDNAMMYIVAEEKTIDTATHSVSVLFMGNNKAVAILSEFYSI